MAEYSYPVSGTRPERIDFIRYLKRSGDQKGALRFWLLNPKGISKKNIYRNLRLPNPQPFSYLEAP